MKKMSKNTMLKIISVVFALFLWSYVRSEVDPERTVTYKDIDVRFENLAEIKEHGLAIVSNMDQKVDVTISGKTSDMDRMDKDNISATVDLSGYSEGEVSIPVKISVDNNANVRVANREPSRINVKIDEIIEDKMDVTITTKGQLKESYMLGKVKPSEEVKVKGPSSVLDSIQKLVAEVDVQGMSESSIKTGKVMAYDKDNNVIESVVITPSTVDIEIPVLKTLTVPIRLNITGNIPDGIDPQTFSIEPNSVMIRGNSAVINKITELTTQPIAIESVLGNRVEVGLVLPDGVSLVDKGVKVVASSQELVPKKMTFNFTSDDFEIVNLGEYEVVFYTKSLNIDCIQKDLLEDYSINKDNIVVSVDLKGLGIGKHDVVPTIKVPEQFKVEKVTPGIIKVEIKKKGIF